MKRAFKKFFDEKENRQEKPITDVKDCKIRWISALVQFCDIDESTSPPLYFANNIDIAIKRLSEHPENSDVIVSLEYMSKELRRINKDLMAEVVRIREANKKERIIRKIK